MINVFGLILIAGDRVVNAKVGGNGTDSKTKILLLQSPKVFLMSDERLEFRVTFILGMENCP